MPVSAVTLIRADLEALEHAPDGAARLLERVEIAAAPTVRPGTVYAEGLYPAFRWRLGPYVETSLFDPDAPIRYELGIDLSARLDLAPGLVLAGALRQSVAGTKDDVTRVSNSRIQRVRSDFALYDREGDPALTDLTLAYYARAGENLYGRITGGYLEEMYGGLSAELLWKPVDSPLALGAELNYVRQRDFDQRFGFRDYQVATGHVSAYWEMGNGFHSTLHAGRYLAGDWGATLALDREFANGWRVGAYATLTDVPFEDFGEGSFDKGLRFTIPLSHFLGQPTRRAVGYTLQPLTRDGGARLNVSGRLYETLRDYHAPGLRQSWGRVWR